MEFWILTILAVISVVYCCDFPVIIDMPWLINNHDSIFYGIGQSIVAAYIFYLIQVVIANRVRLRKCMGIVYNEISELENNMNNILVLLSGKDTLKELADYPEKFIYTYLDMKDIFQDGSGMDKDRKELTILEALIENFKEIDKKVNKILLLNLTDEKTKKLFQDISHASLKKIVYEMKKYESGNIENVPHDSDKKVIAKASIRILNFKSYDYKIVSELKTYNNLFLKLKKVRNKIYKGL
ncbi:MAG: hypothetical protein V8R54_06640 [Coprococcus sp.]|jgi:tRNA(Ile)-lysidine synthase TilS/MesJ